MQIIFPHLNVTNCRFWLAERILRKQNDWNLIEQSTMLWVYVHSLEIKKRVSEHWAFQYLKFYFFGKLENGVCVRQINYVNAISKYLPSNNIYWIHIYWAKCCIEYIYRSSDKRRTDTNKYILVWLCLDARVQNELVHWKRLFYFILFHSKVYRHHSNSSWSDCTRIKFKRWFSFLVVKKRKRRKMKPWNIQTIKFHRLMLQWVIQMHCTHTNQKLYVSSYRLKCLNWRFKNRFICWANNNNSMNCKQWDTVRNILVWMAFAIYKAVVFDVLMLGVECCEPIDYYSDII